VFQNKTFDIPNYPAAETDFSGMQQMIMKMN